MGDRGNIAIIQERNNGKAEQVWIYSHWGGTEMAERLQCALARAPGRWTDVSYLARVIFCEVVPVKDWADETGYGISTQLQDNEHKIVVCDIQKQRVFLMEKNQLKNDTVAANFEPEKAWTFKEYVALKEPPKI